MATETNETWCFEQTSDAVRFIATARLACSALCLAHEVRV